MASFQDAKGRNWTVRIDVLVIRTVMDDTGINIGLLLSDEMQPLNELCSNPIALVNVLFSICKKQSENNVDESDFAESLLGEYYEAAINAFLEALIDFFPKRQSNLLKTMIEKGTELQDGLAPQLEALLDKKIQEISSKVASDLQE